ncbi:hypothetical protein P152DRAFT_259312 [Eremomyces bilateralis CBS 781.70]|uniref:DUF676 domain-containing protein n=1 Tax=Eremomyces bilateralis CBS 781.70 TaxID=1392243 RepID=A0A6G1FQS1_9PEZI|nr:uncharacterized protein P152DRAFT_259312 [Eremomyces bilateralis CBS 781.70]KAF1808002.1 hypothetical protein P152DRAFT_259312 [Eremomyces bilateralis CBS 781.70]
MSSFDGKVSVIGGAELYQGAEELTAPKYNVLAIHGLGSMGVQNAAWTCKQEKEATSWLKNLLPIHAHCSRIMTFDYCCKAIHEGVSMDNIRGLATKLLDQLLDMLEPSVYVVFIAHDLGGLIVKEALSIAIHSSRYHIISGMTSLLVFFGTPHRVSGSKSWESIASWLLHVSGEDTPYSVQRIIKTAQMLRAANEGFDSMKSMYRVINILYQQISPSETAGALMWQVSAPLFPSIRLRFSQDGDA